MTIRHDEEAQRISNSAKSLLSVLPGAACRPERPKKLDAREQKEGYQLDSENKLFF